MGAHTTQRSWPCVTGNGVARFAPCHVFVRDIDQLPAASGASGRLLTASWLHSAMVLTPCCSPVTTSIRVARSVDGAVVFIASSRPGPPMLELLSNVRLFDCAWQGTACAAQRRGDWRTARTARAVRMAGSAGEH